MKYFETNHNISRYQNDDLKPFNFLNDKENDIINENIDKNNKVKFD